MNYYLIIFDGSPSSTYNWPQQLMKAATMKSMKAKKTKVKKTRKPKVSKLFQNKIYVKKSRTHGYGVFADKTIRKGEKIEECYMIISRKGGDKALEDYYFDAKGKHAIFTGYGIIYNHTTDPNADYFINVKRRIATIKAARTIKKGEEIFVSYGEDWFSSRGLTPKETKE